MADEVTVIEGDQAPEPEAVVAAAEAATDVAEAHADAAVAIAEANADAAVEIALAEADASVAREEARAAEHAELEECRTRLMSLETATLDMAEQLASIQASLTPLEPPPLPPDDASGATPDNLEAAEAPVVEAERVKPKARFRLI